MAGPHICYNPASVREDELVRNIFPKDSNTPTPSLAIFWAKSPTFA